MLINTIVKKSYCCKITGKINNISNYKAHTASVHDKRLSVYTQLVVKKKMPDFQKKKKPSATLVSISSHKH